MKVLDKKKTVSEIEFQSAFYQKHFSLSKIRLRAGIIRQAIAAPAGKQLKFMDNKELTELDRKLITLSRSLIASLSVASDSARELPGRVVTAAWESVSYFAGVLKHISEVWMNIFTDHLAYYKNLDILKARSLSDLVGIGLNESQIAMEGIRSNVPFVNNLGLLDGLITWTVRCFS